MDNNNDTQLPDFKKIRALIPNSLYSRLLFLNKFNDNFDLFVTEAILKKLEDDEK